MVSAERSESVHPLRKARAAPNTTDPGATALVVHFVLQKVVGPSLLSNRHSFDAPPRRTVAYESLNGVCAPVMQQIRTLTGDAFAAV